MFVNMDFQIWLQIWWQHFDIMPWWHHQMETFSTLLAICAGIHRSPVNSPHKGQWCRAFMFSFIGVWIDGWVINREAGDLRSYRTHYDVTVMQTSFKPFYHLLRSCFMAPHWLHLQRSLSSQGVSLKVPSQILGRFAATKPLVNARRLVARNLKI